MNASVVLSLLLIGCGSATSALRVDETVKIIDEPAEAADGDTGLNQPPYTFTLPHVSGGARGVADRINRALAFDDFGDWSGASYELALRRGNYLAIRIIKDPFCGAYCDVSSAVDSLFDTRDGHRVTTAELFAPSGAKRLVERIEAARVAQVERAFAEIAPDADERSFYADTLAAHYTDASLAADRPSFSEQGITFTAGYDFPHYAQALEPESPTLSWAEVLPYLAPAHRALAGP